MRVKINKCGGGVNKDLMPSELPPNVWSDALNFRFRNEFAFSRKGMQEEYTAPAVVPWFLTTYLPETGRFVVEAGVARVHVDDGTTQTEITRYADGMTISSITRVGTTATLTAAEAHGRTTGDTVIIYGASPSQYNGTYTITVTGATTWTYTMASDPGASATLISASGYTTNVQSDFTGAIADKWTGGSFNGILVLNNPVDGMYYWAGDTALRLRRMPGWPAGQKADAIMFYSNYVIALAPTISGVKYPHTILWGASAEPGALPDSWTATEVNDAGDTPRPAETGGALVHGETLGDLAVAFKRDARFGIQWIGGNDVFRVFRLPGNEGLLARHCIANTPKGQVFLSNGDVRIHQGGESRSIAEGVIRDWIKRMTDTTNASRSFLATNPVYSEVWVCFPSYGQEACDHAAVWNWDRESWTIFSLPNVTCAATGLIAEGLSAVDWASDAESWESDTTTWFEDDQSPNEARLILATSAPKIALADTGSADLGSAPSRLLEKVGISLDDSDTVKTFLSSRPHLDALAGTEITIYHGSAMNCDDAPVYTDAATFTAGDSNWADAIADGGRYLSWKMEYSGFQPIGMRSYDIDFEPEGTE